MFCSQKQFKEEEDEKTLLYIYFFINEQRKLFEYTFLRNKLNASKQRWNNTNEKMNNMRNESEMRWMTERLL